jgi:branched-chain amino acid transport system substrate-binding protein
MKKILTLLLVAVMVLSLAACGAKTEPAAEAPVESAAEAPVEKVIIKIATVFPMTGDMAEYGKSFSESVQIMVDAANASGELGNYEIEVVRYDDKLSGEEAASVAEIVCADKDIVAVVGGYYSGVAMAATPIYQDNGLLFMSPGCSHVDFCSAGDYIFRNNSLSSVEALYTCDAMVGYHCCTRIGLIAGQDDWGLSCAQQCKDILAEVEGVEVVAYEEVPLTSDDYAVQIANFEAADCDGIIMVGTHPLVVPFVKQYRAINPEIKLGAFTQMYNYQVIELGGDAVEGIVFGVPYANESTDPDAVAFYTEYERRFGVLPDSLSAQSYDSAGMIIEAIKAVGPDRVAIRDYIETIEYKGVVSMLKFDENRTVIKPFMMMVIKDGKNEFIEYEHVLY